MNKVCKKCGCEIKKKLDSISCWCGTEISVCEEKDEKKDFCRNCIHNEVCIYVQKFSFSGTHSRIELAKPLDLDRNCGYYEEIKENL